MLLKFANNAVSVLDSSITAVATSLTVRAGEGALFPTIGVDEAFIITVTSTTGANEIMLVTAATGDTFTVTRGHESTAPIAFSAGAVVQQQLTAGSMASYSQSDAIQPLDATLTALSGLTTAADKLIYATGSDAFSTTTFTAAARALVDDADASAMRTTLGLANAASTNVVTAYTKQQYATPVVLTGQTGSITVNADDYQDVDITATGNLTLGAPSNSARGKYITITLYATSAYTLTFNAVYKASSDATLPTAFVANKRTILSFRCYDGTNWILVGKVIEV